MLGRTLGHYRIREKLGSGGMGDVYAAHDTKLDREVALKVLPPEMEERGRERFEQEAKAIAALDHPNIVHVYSVEEADGVHFITMQLVRGKTLTELLPASGFPLAKFFEIAIPLVDAVASAHREGITHRDLKPDNVMVSDDGRVKVLDFGLAKVKQQLTGLVDSELPTRAATREGHIVGTPSYMSPEQAEGKSVDARSDIFSLGIIFYEMLTGQRPFTGDTPTAVLSSILKDTPRPVSELRPAVPRDLMRLVRRCLAKEPLDRYQTAIDLRHDLEETKQDVHSGDLLPARSGARVTKPLPWAALALLVIAAGVWWFRSRGLPSERAVPQLQNPVQVTSALGVENHPTATSSISRWHPRGRTGFCR